MYQMQSKVIVVAPANEITSMCFFAQIASTFSWQIEQQLLVDLEERRIANAI
jgi:hypothetical protein